MPDPSIRFPATPRVVRKERLELSRVAPLAPKASASTKFRHFRVSIFSIIPVYAAMAYNYKFFHDHK